MFIIKNCLNYLSLHSWENFLNTNVLSFILRARITLGNLIAEWPHTSTLRQRSLHRTIYGRHILYISVHYFFFAFAKYAKYHVQASNILLMIVVKSTFVRTKASYKM